ncbi:TM2 domain-containing protein [Helicobacter sp. MIT 21-1697]|uniref:TM2 domain-containing protein n=1 Tax=Helicobacter sp. MIT 21-1697 TaxID=2993733 RepID=UPI00224AEA13|nr:TM2 domain-containing protein [Helicobacter sp. MIT 21-1697]MCX2716898.1 TM2 domain-containing protein [Helicobacter sp. MIT 21-1697]
MNDKAMMMIATWADKLPDNAALILQERLEKLPEEKLSSLSLIQLKNPVVGLVLGLFLGILGADRFYKGDIVLGIVKLLLCWATLYIWAIVDLVLVWKGIKQDNLNKISNQLMMLGI